MTFNWGSTPIDREEKISTGKWIDITQSFIGKRADTGVINICCSMEFYRKALGTSTNDEKIIELLRPHLTRQSKFTIKRGRETYSGICINSTEVFRGKQTICYTIFMGDPNGNDYR